MTNSELLAIALRYIAALVLLLLILCGGLTVGAIVNLYLYRRDQRRSR